MKEWKTIVVTAVILLLVVAMGLVAWNSRGTLISPVPVEGQSISPEQALANLKVRVGQLDVLWKEQTLTRDIMVLQQEIRELTLKAQAPPVIEGEFIPIDEMPDEAKKME